MTHSWPTETEPRQRGGTFSSLSLKVLAVLAVLYTLYLTQTLFMPIVVSAFIALFSSRLVRGLSALKVPRPLAALCVIAVLVTASAYVVSLVVEPATRWLQAVPAMSDRLANELDGVSEPLKVLKETVISATSGERQSIEQAMSSKVNSLLSVMAQSTVIFVAQVLAVIVMTYFFLVFGDDLMRNVVRAQSSFRRKKMTVKLFQIIQEDVSQYVLVISCINLGLGVATASLMAVIGVEDALLWGALAAMLNFAPYVGPTILALILTGVGFVEFSDPVRIVMVPALFVALNFIEFQFVTPTVLGKRFDMNPLLVVIWMFAWGWFWGAVGMLIAIPLLVCFKILATHLDLVGAWVKVIDGNYSRGVKAA